MSRFKLSKYICKDIDRESMNFFWNDNKQDNICEQNQFILSIAWDIICRPKCEADLGINKI